jgi:hypothetical protein
MFTASLIVLAVAGIAAVVALTAGHIPYLREWTGAAPLQAEEPDTSADFARSVADGFVELPTWDPKPAPLHLPEENAS